MKMDVSIGRWGRITLPSALRQELDLHPGTLIEVEQVGYEIRMRAAEPGALAEQGGLWVHTGTTRGDI